jgi:hypothetical protein
VVKIPTSCKSVISRNILHISGTLPSGDGYFTSTQEVEMTFRSTIVIPILLAGTAFATAQTVVVTPEQETIVREYVRTNPVVVERPSNFELVIGAIVPDIFKPGELAENRLPNRYQYVVMDGRTVLIDPQTRRVVHIID